MLRSHLHFYIFFLKKVEYQKSFLICHFQSYLSQKKQVRESYQDVCLNHKRIKSDHVKAGNLHETFQINPQGSPKLIQHVKGDPILQVSSQEPSAPSKYDIKGKGFLTHFYSCQIAEIWHTSQELYIMMIYDVENDPFPSIKSGIIRILQA